MLDHNNEAPSLVIGIGHGMNSSSYIDHL